MQRHRINQNQRIPAFMQPKRNASGYLFRQIVKNLIRDLLQRRLKLLFRAQRETPSRV
jgi:hypothetical protein